MIDVPPANRAVVSATMGGYIKTAPLLVGDKVRKGQVLLSIENPSLLVCNSSIWRLMDSLRI